MAWPDCWSNPRSNSLEKSMLTITLLLRFKTEIKTKYIQLIKWMPKNAFWISFATFISCLFCHHHISLYVWLVWKTLFSNEINYKKCCTFYGDDDIKTLMWTLHFPSSKIDSWNIKFWDSEIYPVKDEMTIRKQDNK